MSAAVYISHALNIIILSLYFILPLKVIKKFFRPTFYRSKQPILDQMCTHLYTLLKAMKIIVSTQ